MKKMEPINAFLLIGTQNLFQTSKRYRRQRFQLFLRCCPIFPAIIAHHLRPGFASRGVKKSRLAPSNPVSTWLRLLRIAVSEHRLNFRNVIGIEDGLTAVPQSGG